MKDVFMQIHSFPLQAPMMAKRLSPRFSSIYSCMTPANTHAYKDAQEQNPQNFALMPHQTKIFRDGGIPAAIAYIIGRERADVHILGCSDGSDAYSYAIAVKEAREASGETTDSVRFYAVDTNPALIQLAKQGFIVCADQEKNFANIDNTPLAGEGWERYLVKSSEVDPVELNAFRLAFQTICEKHPDLRQIERDTVADVSVGRGMDWYQVNKSLPKISFNKQDMMAHVKQPYSAPLQVYVMANTLAYLWRDYERSGNLNKAEQLFADIKKQNKGKDVIIVTGDTEKDWLYKNPRFMHAWFRAIGLLPAHFDNPVPFVDSKIWNLNTD